MRYLKKNLRYSQLAPLSMFEETNTKQSTTAGRDGADGPETRSAYVPPVHRQRAAASANKSFLFQATPSDPHPRPPATAFLKEKVLTLASPRACPTIPQSSSAAPAPR